MGFFYYLKCSFFLIQNLFKYPYLSILLREREKEPLLWAFSVNENRFGVNKIKKQLKSLLPTLKQRKRYLAFEIISKQPITDYKSVSTEILAKTQEFLGILGMARAGIQIIKYKNHRGLIKVNHKHVDELKASLTFIEKIKNQKVIVRSIGVSGIIKKAEKKYLK